MKLVLATHNQHKIEELKAILSPYNIDLLSLKDIGVKELVCPENGDTYKENSLIKAKEASLYTSFPVISDDSGIEIEALDNQPGVKTARFADKYGGYYNAIQEILKQCKLKNNYRATFTCSITLVNLTNEPLNFEARIPGSISTDINGQNGFGFDPVFTSDEVGIPNAYLSKEEKNKHSARGKALEKLIKYLQKNNYLK